MIGDVVFRNHFPSIVVLAFTFQIQFGEEILGSGEHLGSILVKGICFSFPLTARELSSIPRKMINDSTRKPKAYTLLLYLLSSFPTPTCGQIGFSCVFWLGMPQIPESPQLRFLKGLWLLLIVFCCCYTRAIICCRWHKFLKHKNLPLPLWFLSIFINWRQTTAQTDRKACSQVCGDLKELADS